jgi:UDP-N-acetylmuramate--alanine ligase
MYERTRTFYQEFLTAFQDADLVVVPNIYVARSDIEREMVEPEQFVRDITEIGGTPAQYGESLEKTRVLLGSMLQPDDVVVCMGAGDIAKLAALLVGA